MASGNTSFRFDFYDSQPKELSYHGDASFPKETPFLRLTKTDYDGTPHFRSAGRVHYSKPVIFGKDGARANFQTTVKFVVRADTSKSYGDGIVFFIVPEGHEFPAYTLGSSLGVYSQDSKSPHLFAVEFDIFGNRYWDPDYIHLGINIESKHSASFNRIPEYFLGKELTLHVNYIAATGLITASLTDGAESFSASYTYDLTEILPPHVHVGLAASTGDSAAVHDVSYWDFTSTLVNK